MASTFSRFWLVKVYASHQPSVIVIMSITTVSSVLPSLQLLQYFRDGRGRPLFPLVEDGMLKRRTLIRFGLQKVQGEKLTHSTPGKSIFVPTIFPFPTRCKQTIVGLNRGS